MNTRLNSESADIRANTRATTRFARAALNPSMSRAIAEPPPWAAGRPSNLVVSTARITKPYVNALNPNAQPGVPRVAAAAANTGPNTREPFMLAEFNATAPARSDFPTRAGNSAPIEGPTRELAIPMPATTVTRAQRFGWPFQLSTARTADRVAWTVEPNTMVRRRLYRSAMTPPKLENSSIGPSWAKVTMPTNTALRVIELAKAPRVTFCIQVPMFEENCPKNIRRNGRCARAAMTGLRGADVTVFGSAAVLGDVTATRVGVRGPTRTTHKRGRVRTVWVGGAGRRPVGWACGRFR